MKKGRHRRFEEARALTRGPDIDIEHIFEEESEDDGVAQPGRSGWYEDEDVAAPVSEAAEADAAATDD